MYGVDLNVHPYLNQRKIWKGLFQDLKELDVKLINKGGIWI